MANVFSIFIPCTPKAVQSDRSFSAGKKIIHYQPAKVVDWKAFIRISVLNKLDKDWEPLDGPVDVVLAHLFLPRKTEKKAVLKLIEEGMWVYKTTRPDKDNLGKGFYDACSGLLWKDDAQVAHSDEIKAYAKVEGVFICVKNLPQSIPAYINIS